MKLMKSIIALAAALAATVGHAGDSAPFFLDTMIETRVPRATETITYSTAWGEPPPAGAVAVVEVNGTTLISNSGDGSVVWTPPRQGGTYTLTYKLMLGSVQYGETLTATFHVFPTGAVTDVIAKQRYPWGLIDIACSVTGIVGTTDELKFAVAAVDQRSGTVHKASRFWVVRNGQNSTDLKVRSNGDYRLLWDARADLPPQIHSNMVVRVTLDTDALKVQLWEGGPYWATTNIGAEKPEDYGYYFWWGDTVGYKRENDKWVASDGSSSNYSFATTNTPTYNKSIATLKSKGWITADSVLVRAHDAAHVHWGGDWRMPTEQEIADLNSKCEWIWTARNGVQGCVVKGKATYASASIFLPCSGYGGGTSLNDTGSDLYYPVGYYWSSVPYSDNDYRALDFGFFSDSHGRYSDSGYRRRGQPVRPVQKSAVTIAFNANGGTGGTTVTRTYGSTLGALPTPSRDGYTFAGWWSAVNNGMQVTETEIVTVDATYYAHWTANASEYHAKVQLWEGGPYWATTNIGAGNPEEYGYYFWWGDTIGYKRENDKWVASDGSSSNYSFATRNTPTYNKSIATLQSKGWITADEILVPAHDAAHVHWGGDWRMPTYQELCDLNSKCDWTETTQNGVQGYVVRGKDAYASASIFLPCAGYGSGTSLNDAGGALNFAGSNGQYWSSVPYPDDYDDGAWRLHFGSGDPNTNGDGRFYGKSVRPVQGFTE